MNIYTPPEIEILPPEKWVGRLRSFPFGAFVCLFSGGVCCWFQGGYRKEQQNEQIWPKKGLTYLVDHPT